MNPFVPLIALYCTSSDLPWRESSAVSADALLDIQGRVWKEFLWNPKWTRFDQLTRSNFGNFSSGSPTSMNSSPKTHVIVQASSQTPVSLIWKWIAHQHLPLEIIDKHKWQTWIYLRSLIYLFVSPSGKFPWGALDIFFLSPYFYISAWSGLKEMVVLSPAFSAIQLLKGLVGEGEGRQSAITLSKHYPRNITCKIY